MFKGIPKQLKLGPYRITFEVCDQVENGECWGQYNLHTRQILLERNQPCDGSAAAVALHEVLHAIWHLSNINSGPVEEERVVEIFSTWLTMAFADNKAFLKWYTGQLPK